MDKATAIKQRAQALIQRNALNEAMSEYEKLLGIEPLDPYAYILLGDLAVRMKNRDVVLKRYGQAVDAYESQGLCRNAIAVLKKIQRIDAAQFESLRRLADLYARESLMAEAMAHYLEFASKCLESNREDDTKQVLEIAVQLGTPNAKVALRVAELFVAVGDRQRAAIELERMAGELESRGQAERAAALRARAAELAPRIDLREATIALTPVEEAGAEAVGPVGADAATTHGAGGEESAEDDHQSLIVEGSTIADYSRDETAAPAESATGASPLPSDLENVMPGLERMGDLFGPASSGAPCPPASFLGLEITAHSVERPAESAASDASGESDVAATADDGDAGEDVIVLNAGEESAAVIETVMDEADDMAARVRGWATEVAAHLETGDREAAEAVLAAAASESELAGENTTAQRFLLELWELGKRELQVAEKLKELAITCGDRAAEARWTAEIGENHLADGDWDRARAAFERALELDPEEPLALRRNERLKHLVTTETAAAAETEVAASLEAVESAEIAEPVAESVAEERGAEFVPDVDLIIETDIGAHAVPLAVPEEPAAVPELVIEAEAVVEAELFIEAEPVAEAAPVAEAEPVVEAETMLEAEPVAETGPLFEDLPLAEMESLTEAEPLAEIEPLTEAEPVAALPAGEISDPEVIQLDHGELRGGAVLDGVSVLDFLGGNGDRAGNGDHTGNGDRTELDAPAAEAAAPSAGVAPPAAVDPTTDDQLAWVIGRFRRDVSSQLGATDHASHYDLGMAYMEMGLHQEAIAEFRQAVGGASYRRRCLELLATCYSRSGEPNLAASYWRAALEEATRTGEGILPIRYALALSLAAAGEFGGARDELREVVRSDPGFLDARERLQALDA